MRLPLAKSMTVVRSFLLHGRRNTAWVRLPDCRVDGHAPASAARASSVGTAAGNSRPVLGGEPAGYEGVQAAHRGRRAILTH
jgi:hypothetical protein